MENQEEGGKIKDPLSSRNGKSSVPGGASGQSQQAKSAGAGNQRPDQPNADTSINRAFFKRSGRKLL